MVLSKLQYFVHEINCNRSFIRRHRRKTIKTRSRNRRSAVDRIDLHEAITNSNGTETKTRRRKKHNQEITMRVPRLRTRHRHRILFLQPAASLFEVSYDLGGRDAGLFGMKRRGDGSGIWGLFYLRAAHDRGEVHKVRSFF